MKLLRISLYLISASFIIAAPSSAQPGFLIPFMPEVGTSIQYRPSVLPTNSYFFSLPVLPVTDTRIVNSGLDYQEAHMVTSSGMYLNLDKLFAKLQPMNTLGVNQQLDVVDIGIKAGKGYFSMNLSHRFDFTFLYTDDFMNLLYKGNGTYIGENVNLSRCGLDASHYWDIGFGYTRKLNDHFTAGFRVKRLIGLDNISTSIQSLTATTMENDYTLQLSSNTVVNTCSPLLGNNGPAADLNGISGISDYLMGSGNGGWGANIGLSYQPFEKLVLSFDALDIGKITWKSVPVNYHLDRGVYSFSGVSLNQLLSQDVDSVSYLDSLASSFPTTETNQRYTTTLPSTLMLSTQYSLTASTVATLSFRGTLFQQQFLPSFMMMLHQRIGNFFAVSMNYSYQYNHVSSIGAGAYLRIGVVNLFLLTDNLTGTLYPLSGKTSHINFGILFGSPVKAKKQRAPKAFEKNPPEPQERY